MYIPSLDKIFASFARTATGIVSSNLFGNEKFIDCMSLRRILEKLYAPEYMNMICEAGIAEDGIKFYPPSVVGGMKAGARRVELAGTTREDGTTYMTMSDMGALGGARRVELAGTTREDGYTYKTMSELAGRIEDDRKHCTIKGVSEWRHQPILIYAIYTTKRKGSARGKRLKQILKRNVSCVPKLWNNSILEPTVDLVTARQLEKNIEIRLRRQRKYYALYRNVGINNLEVNFARDTTGPQRNEQHPYDTN